jgi:hypothetical protein
MLRYARRGLLAGLLAALVAVSAVPSALATFPGQNGRIAYMRFDDDGRFQIWTADPDLSDAIQLTHGTDDGWFPSWSPDGSRIAFSSYRTDPDLGDGYEVHDVFTMRADGTDVRQVTDSLGYSGKPSWSPDGRWLLFDADRADYPRSQGIYIVPADGAAAAGSCSTRVGAATCSATTRTAGLWPSSRRCSRSGPTVPICARSLPGASMRATPTGRRMAHASCSGHSRHTSATSAT